MNIPLPQDSRPGASPQQGQNTHRDAIHTSLSSHEQRSEDLNESPEQVSEADVVIELEVECRRCGKSVPARALRCNYCDARISEGNVSDAGSSERGTAIIDQFPSYADASEEQTALTRLMVFYLALLGTNLVAAIFLHKIDNNLPDEAIAKQALKIILTVEAVDSFLILIALTMISRPPKLQAVSATQRIACWGMAPLFLAALLGINFAYHHLLNNYVQFPEWAMLRPDAITAWTIVAICVQPAIMEEIFFRYLALGSLNRVMGLGGAVMISAIMFGMAHSGAPLSIPILTVIGAGLALVRIWSGSLMLPIILHAFHNGAVLYFERVS